MASQDDQTWIYRAIASYRAYEEQRWRDTSSEANHWQTEAIKHLALLNGTALTGTVALLVTERGNGSLLIPLGLFLIAFIVLIYGMHLACVGLFQRARDYVGRIQELDNRTTSTGDGPVSALKFAQTALSKGSLVGESTIAQAIRLAWLAAGMFIVGAIILVTLLYCGLHAH